MCSRVMEASAISALCVGTLLLFQVPASLSLETRPHVKEGHCNADCQTDITDEAMFHLLRSTDELVWIHEDALEKSRAISVAISSAWGERYRQTPASSIYASSESGSETEMSGDSMAPPGLDGSLLCSHW